MALAARSLVEKDDVLEWATGAVDYCGTAEVP